MSLRSELISKGYSEDTVDEVVERAATIESDGVDHWRAAIQAQQQLLGEAVATSHDL